MSKSDPEMNGGRVGVHVSCVTIATFRQCLHFQRWLKDKKKSDNQSYRFCRVPGQMKHHETIDLLEFKQHCSYFSATSPWKWRCFEDTHLFKTTRSAWFFSRPSPTFPGIVHSVYVFQKASGRGVLKQCWMICFFSNSCWMLFTIWLFNIAMV